MQRVNVRPEPSSSSPSSPHGLRAGDAGEIRRIVGGDMKLLLRVGALLEARLAWTELALEGAVAAEGGRKLLQDRRLKDADAERLSVLGTEHGCSELDLTLVAAADDWRVIALADEIGNPFAPFAAKAEPKPDAAAPPDIHVPELFRGQIDGVLQARGDQERAAALEQLRYASPPLDVVGGLMPMLLADAAELVRERAIGLLTGAGAHVVIIDLVRALHRRDDAAVMRLAESVHRLLPVQQEIAASVAIAAASRGQVTPGLICLCENLSQVLVHHRDMPRLIELLLPSGLSLVELVRSLQGIDALRINATLDRMLGMSPETDANLLILLAAPGNQLNDSQLSLGIDLLLSAEGRPRERMPLAAALRRSCGDRLAPALAGAASRIAGSFDATVHWLIAELARDGRFDADQARAIAAAIRQILRSSPGPHLVTTLEQQVPSLLPLPDAERAAFVEPLIELVARYRDERTSDLVEAAVLALGRPALAALWGSLEDHPLDRVRLLALHILPDLVLASAPDLAAPTQERLLSGLVRAEQAAERGALLTASARLAQSSGTIAALAVIDQAAASAGRWGVPARGHLAAAKTCEPERRLRIIEDLLQRVRADLPASDAPGTVDAATGDMAFTFDERLSEHTEVIPEVLSALERIAISGNLSADAVGRIVDELGRQWKRIAAWQQVWGPANVLALARTLGRIAAAPTTPSSGRIRIAEILLPQVMRLVVAEVLCPVLAHGGSYLERLAGRAASELVRLAAEDDYYADDEREQLATVLAGYLALTGLGPQGEPLRRRLAHLVTGLRTSLPQLARARLRAALPNLPEDVRTRLEWV